MTLPAGPGPVRHAPEQRAGRSLLARAGRQLGPGVVLALLVAFALSGFSSRLPGGVRTAGRAVVRDLATQPPRPSVGGCAHLSPTLRAGVTPLAFMLDGTLRSVALDACRSRTLVRGGVLPPVRFSADGRWIGYGTGTAIAAAGGQVERPLGATALQAPGAWAWSPQGATMAGITRSGAIVVGRPGGEPVRVEPSDWGASQILFAGAQTLVAVREAAIWTIPLDGAPPRVIYRASYRRAELRLALGREGYVVFWELPDVSTSASAAGAPLSTVSIAGGPAIALASAVAIHPENVVACGSGVAVVTGTGLSLPQGRQVVVYSTAWHPRVLGAGNAPSCSADGRVIAFADGPVKRSETTGNERRRIWVVTDEGRPQPLSTAPPSGVSDERPFVSPDGRTVTWIRTTGPAGGAAGNPHPYVGQVRVAAVGSVDPGTPITSVGSTDDTAGRLGWNEVISVAGPPPPATARRRPPRAP